MAMRIIDLSIPLTADVVSDPATMRPQITYSDHATGAKQIAAVFPRLKPEDLPDGEGWAVEQITLSTHNGTHMDAPWHFHSTTDGGVRAPSIDEAPLDLFLKPGVKLDFRSKADGHVVSAVEIEAELDRIGHELQPLEIVLINTSAGKAYGDPEYIHKGCGMGEEATLYLTGRGIKVVGTDAWSWDAPFSHTARRFAESQDPKIIWEGHKAGRIRSYYQMEKLHGLEQLPGYGFTVACFPVKVARGSAGWTRAVAIIED